MARIMAVFITGAIVLVALAAMATTRKNNSLFFDAPPAPVEATSLASRAG